MVKRSNQSELAIVCALFLLGVALRNAAPERMEVEHFDEGVYASVLWHDAVVGSPYPARQLYAPPLLSTLIEAFALIPGCARMAPFLPSLLAGALTTLILWRLVRSWFGSAAGLFVAAIVITGFDDYEEIIVERRRRDLIHGLKATQKLLRAKHRI